MTIRTRRKIFYTLVALFIIFGGGVVLYAQGWRLDFATWHFEKIGGIYVRAYPENVSIYLNGKPIQNQSGFLTQGTLISDLLPRTYRVTLKYPGYDTWEENAEVAPSLVTQFKYAVLIPANGTSTPTSTAKEIALASAANDTATTTDPYDQNQKIIIGKNKISIYNIALATTTASTTVLGKTVAATWISGSVIGILQSDGELYKYDVSGQILAKLADNVKSFSAANDGSMVAALESQSLEVFSLYDSSIYYRFNIPDIADASQGIWYRDHTHLFIAYPDHVAFLDLADTSLINFVTVAHGTKPFYDPQANVLYVTSGRLIQYQFPD